MKNQLEGTAESGFRTPGLEKFNRRQRVAAGQGTAGLVIAVQLEAQLHSCHGLLATVTQHSLWAQRK